MEHKTVKEIPYGVSDFVTIVEQNIYYVDKTMYIPEIENQARNIFFIRPRRFGKSVFLGMLHAYYDCHTKDKFQQWFGNLWIGKHPTLLQGRYQVLHLDFSQVGGTIDKLEEKFNDYYYTAPELELNHGYCDFFLLPDLTHYAAKHSYILELKMLPKQAPDEAFEKQWQEAVVQINRYAVAPRVETLRQGTGLHKIIMQFRGWDLERMEEIL